MKLNEEKHKVSFVTAELVKASLEQEGEFRYQFLNKDDLLINREKGSFYSIGEVDYLQVSYGEYAPDYLDDGKDGWMCTGTQYFHPSKIDEAVACFMRRLVAENKLFDDGSGEKLEIIKIRQSQVLKFESHYTYCDIVLNKFWQKVFGKTASEMFCGGIVGAHGDKCYCSKVPWKEAGIEFHHGALLFLLSYTKVFGDTPKHLKEQWVIDNYPKYKPIIDEVEQEILAEQFSN